MTTAGSADEWYRQRCREVEEERRALAARSRLISNVRLVLFLIMLGILVWAESVGTMGTPPLVAAGMFGVAFLGAVIFHAKLRERDTRLETVHTVHQEAIHRVQRQWDDLPPAKGDVTPEHPYAKDLDLLGHASVFQLLGAVRTPSGRRALHGWLLSPAPPTVVRSRQAAVRELAPQDVFRERFEVAAFEARSKHEEELRTFLTWIAESPWLSGRRGLVWLARATAIVTPLLLVAHLVGLMAYAWWLIPVMINVVVSGRAKRAIHERFRRATAYESALPSLAVMLDLFGQERWESDLLVEYRNLLSGDGHTAPAALRHVHRIMSFAEFRRTWLHPVVQWLGLWDVHVLAALERWRVRHGHAAREWLDLIGPVEALCGLAGLARDNPSWCYPEIEADGPIELSADQLGHPLLRESVRVANDVRIGPPGTFLLVTGSNMSGKSTLLRAIGVNVVLGQAGAPVCCRRMRFSPVRLWTSMRVDDSLEHGVSFFMAALQRLKLIIDAARNGADHDTRLLYLLDEIMQGTNSAERLVAVREIVRELIDRGAIGAMTTHDLALAEAPELATAAQAVHFSETIDAREGGAMTFDYKLQPGIATSRNALRLMELMGLRRG